MIHMQKIQNVWRDPIGRVVITGITAIVLIVLTSILQEITPDLLLMWMIIRAVLLVVVAVLVVPQVLRIRQESLGARCPDEEMLTHRETREYPLVAFDQAGALRLTPPVTSEEIMQLIETHQGDYVLWNGQAYLTNAGKARQLKHAEEQ